LYISRAIDGSDPLMAQQSVDGAMVDRSSITILCITNDASNPVSVMRHCCHNNIV